MPRNTSKKPANTRTSREKVFNAIKRRRVNGGTSDEIERVLGLPHQNVAARISELFGDGVLEVTGFTRLTRYGRPANVYYAVPPMDLSSYLVTEG